MFHVNPMPRIHMKHQVLVSVKKRRKKYSSLSSAAFRDWRLMTFAV